MRWSQKIFLSVTIAVLACSAVITSVNSVSANDTAVERITANLTGPSPFADLDFTPPPVEKPDWYYKKTLTYSVSQNGVVSMGLEEFAALADASLNDPRGWARLGVKFVRVASGGNFRLILSQAALVPSYSPTGCSAEWSCRVGNNVVINNDRWMGASTAWNNGGGTLRDYRHMVVNHETGHWLGHDHASCGGAGQPAPLMQQQSIGLQGCTFNPWPLDRELWSNRL